MANNGIYYSSGNTLNFTTNNTTWATITSGGTFQMSAVSATTYYNLPPATFTGGTVSGATNFTGGLTANTISATTYQNLPYSGTVVGTGTTNYIPKWTNTTELTDSQLVDDGSQVYIGSAPTHTGTKFNAGGGVEVGESVQVIGRAASIGITDTDLHGWTTNGNEIAIGTGGPLAISTGNDNIAIGGGSQSQNDTGVKNVSVGVGTLISNQVGQENTVIGHKAGFSVTSGSSNVLIGNTAGYNLETGENNVFLGNSAGFNETGSNKLYIENSGGTPLIYGEFDNKIVNINGTLSATTYSNLPTDIKTTGATYSNNTFTYTNNTGGTFSVLFNTVTGLTVNGILTVTGNTSLQSLTATTISATTYQNLPGSSSANCVTTFFVTNISGCSPVNMLSPLNVQDGLSVTGTSTFTSQANFTGGLSANTFSATTYQNLPSATFTGGTVSGATNFTGGLTANTISATTYQNLPTTVSGLTSTDGISGNTTSGNVTIINTDKGSSQNIFKNIKITGTTQFSAGSNSSDLNFSGVNITITSAATNTLVFSADTGGGVTSVTAGSGLSGNTTTGVITLITNISASSISDSTTVGQNLITIPNPSEIRYLRINANNSITTLTLAQLKTDLGSKQISYKTNDQGSNILAFADLTDLSFSVVSGKTYRFKILCRYDVTNTSTGSRWAVNGPAFTRLFYSVLWTNGTGLQSNTAFDSYDATTSTTNSNFTTNNCAIIEGVIIPSASGTLSARFACELTITTVTCKAGSFIEYEEI